MSEHGGREPLLAISGLHKAFGGLVAVNQLAFAVDEGEILGLIGPNGSGKTTVLNLITGDIRPDAGRVRLSGRNLVGLSPNRICRRRVSRTFQLVRVFPGMTARENVLVGSAFGSRRTALHASAGRVDELLDYVGLADQAARPAGKLTYVDQKRVELARALATDPALLLLDEWLAGLNQTELREGIELVRRIQGARYHLDRGRACHGCDTDALRSRRRHERGPVAGRGPAGRGAGQSRSGDRLSGRRR